MFNSFLLVPLTYMNNIISISSYTDMKNYKTVNTYHQVFCYPGSVSTKRENPMIYGVNFVFVQAIVRVECSPFLLLL